MHIPPFVAVLQLRGAVPSALFSVAALTGAAIAVQQQLDLHAVYVVLVLGAFVAGAVLALGSAVRHLEGAFGAANQVTLFRGALTSLAAGLIIAEQTAAASWLAIMIAGGALLLDGVDGSLARRRSIASPFGARFDMETDAVSIVVLSVLVWHFGKAGPWVLATGALRYLFVAAGAVWPWLRAPLPPSRRRQSVCVVQIAALLVCLAPFVSSEQSALIAAAALAILVASFAADTLWLARHAVRAR